MTRTLRMITLLALATALTVPACLFDTREDDVEPPDLGGNTIILDDPLKVFTAINETLKTRQDANYERAISDRFVFSPTLQDSLDQNFIGTGVYDNWNKQREMDVLALLLGDALFLRGEFTPTEEINTTTFVRFRVSYELDVVSVAAPLDTVSYQGVAFFDTRLESGNWRLTFWDESEPVTGFSTWGYLRGVLGLQLN